MAIFHKVLLSQESITYCLTLSQANKFLSKMDIILRRRPKKGLDQWPLLCRRCLKICNIVPQCIKCYISKEFEFAFFPKQIPSMFCEFGVFPVCWLDKYYLVSLCCWRRVCWKCKFFRLGRPWHWAPWSRCSGYGSFWGGLPGRLEAGTSWTPDPASHPHRWPRDPWSWKGHLEKKAMRND